MAFFDVHMYYGGYFGHDEEGIMRYKDGEKTVVGGQDADFWSVFEAEEQLAHQGVDRSHISAMWYKDPQVVEFDIGLMQFENDRDAIEMVRLGLSNEAKNND
ncbi:hypothetical protein PIB30_037628 [Stylosanthes scabra]|uniref:PB1-like domain-containing protein n=1 Tax=Stylosanthes scabra TaxID=79078 RepID=A0ABU6QF99_9FABA|nr:hypothetical protein [Stylosanthes scabra]